MVTRVGTKQIKDDGILREDLNITIPGKAVITNLKAGVGISLISTGIEEGTGEVTVSATENLSFSYRKILPGVSIEILDEHQMSIHGELTIHTGADLKIKGELVIARG